MKFNISCFAVLLTLLGCGNSEENLSQEDRLTKLLDERRYSDVIEIIESSPEDSRYDDNAPYLAQAYMGRAGVEPLNFTSSILDYQPNDQILLDELIPDCSREAILSSANPEVRCVVWRLFRRINPEVIQDLEKAAQVFKTARSLSNPETTKPGYNLLAAITESLLLVSSFKSVLLNYHQIDAELASDSEIQNIFNYIADSARHAAEALRRIRHSTKNQFTKQLTGLDQSPIIDGLQGSVIGGRTFNFAEATGIPMLIRISESKEKNLETVAGKILIIQKLDQIVEAFSHSSDPVK